MAVGLEQVPRESSSYPVSKSKVQIHGEPDGGYHASRQPKRLRVIGRGRSPGVLRVVVMNVGTTPGVVTISIKEVSGKRI